MERVDLPKSVHNIPSVDEFNGLDDNELTYDELDFSSDDSDLEELMAVLLALYFEFYESVMYKDSEYFVSDKFKRDMVKFNGSLKENWSLMMKQYIESKQDYWDTYWFIPTDTVKLDDFNVSSLIKTGIDTVTDTLLTDLMDKATYYTLMENTSGQFIPHSNFRRGLKRLKNQIDFKTQSISKHITRKYDEFVYGKEALFNWVCSGINTCAWCYMVEAESPMPLSMLPVDHPNGGCRVVPYNPDDFSKDYLDVRI